jgi:hypothetical protein
LAVFGNAGYNDRNIDEVRGVHTGYIGSFGLNGNLFGKIRLRMADTKTTFADGCVNLYRLPCRAVNSI